MGLVLSRRIMLRAFRAGHFFQLPGRNFAVGVRMDDHGARRVMVLRTNECAARCEDQKGGREKKHAEKLFDVHGLVLCCFFCVINRSMTLNGNLLFLFPADIISF